MVDELAEISKARRHTRIVAAVDLQFTAVAIDTHRIRSLVFHGCCQRFELESSGWDGSSGNIRPNLPGWVR